MGLFKVVNQWPQLHCFEYDSISIIFKVQFKWLDLPIDNVKPGSSGDKALAYDADINAIKPGNGSNPVQLRLIYIILNNLT